VSSPCPTNCLKQTGEGDRLRRLGLVLIFAGCQPGLPAAPAVEARCAAHTVCPLSAPLCAATGLCSADPDGVSAVDHLVALLPGDGTLHWAKLDAGFDAWTDFRGARGNWQTRAQSPHEEWLLLDGGENAAAVHRSGLVGVRLAPDHGQLVALLDPAKLHAKSPQLTGDMRLLSGYAELLSLITVAKSLDLLGGRDAVVALDRAEHGLMMAAPRSVVITDLMTGDTPNLFTTLGIGNSTALQRHAYPKERTAQGSQAELSKTVAFTLSGPGAITWHPTTALSSGDPSPVKVTVWRGGGVVSEVAALPDNRTTRLELEPGAYRMTLSGAVNGNPAVRRTVIDSASPIGDLHWSSSGRRGHIASSAPRDDHKRPALLIVPAGLVDDSDGDRWPDAADLCPDVPDDGVDSDQDGVGDACDGLKLVRVTGDGEQRTVVGVDFDDAPAVELTGAGLSATAVLAPAVAAIDTGDDEWVINGGQVMGLAVQLGRREPIELKRPDGTTWLTLRDGVTVASRLRRAVRGGGALLGLMRWGLDSTSLEPTLFSRLNLLDEVILNGRTQLRHRGINFTILAAEMTIVPSHSNLGAVLGGFDSAFALISGRMMFYFERYRSAEPWRGLCIAGVGGEAELAQDSFDICDTRDLGTGCALTELCAPTAPPPAGQRDAVGGLLTAMAFESLRGGVLAVPVPTLSPDNRAVQSPQDGSIGVDMSEFPLTIGLCYAPFADNRATDDAGRHLVLQALFRARVSGGSEAMNALFTLGVMNILTGSCLALPDLWHVPLNRLLQPQAITLRDIDGDTIEEIVVKAAVGGAVMEPRDVTYRCFNYEGEQVQQGCGPG
jgi:hypothetical protein